MKETPKDISPCFKAYFLYIIHIKLFVISLYRKTNSIHMLHIIDKEHLESSRKFFLFDRMRQTLCDWILKLQNKFAIENVCQCCEKCSITVKVLFRWNTLRSIEERFYQLLKIIAIIFLSFQLISWYSDPDNSVSWN